MRHRLVAGALALVAIACFAPAAESANPVSSVSVRITWGTMVLPPGSSPASVSYVAASANLPSEVLNDLIQENPGIASLLASLRDLDGPNTALPNLFTVASTPEAGFGTSVAKARSIVRDVTDPSQLLLQAIVLGVPGTGTGQSVRSISSTSQASTSHSYPGLMVASGPGCTGCTFDGRVDVGLERLDFSVGNPAPGVTIPIVLSTTGLNGSFYTSELTLTNRGTSDASIAYSYTAAGAPLSGSDGTATDVLGAGQQRVIPDTIAYLHGLGIPVGDAGNRGGSLTVTFEGLSSPDAGTASVRTTTAVAGGRAGAAYPGLLSPRLLTTPVIIAGLRQTAIDRSNIALINAGGPFDGSITLRVTAFSGFKLSNFEQDLPDFVLAPGAFTQISGVLASNGINLTNGYVEVQRVNGTAPFYAYGVINSQGSSDGSFVPPVPLAPAATIPAATLPSLVETGSYRTELSLTNFSHVLHQIRFTFFSPALTGGSATLTIKLEGGEQQILPDFVQVMRNRGAIVDPAGPVFAGPLVAVDTTGDLGEIAIGGRIATPGNGGEFGVFAAAIPSPAEASERAWIYGLQQNAETRTNLAIVNPGTSGSTTDVFRIDLYDPATGLVAKTFDGIAVPAGGFVQLNSILLGQSLSNAYALVTRDSGSNTFIAYGVVNDGAVAGQRTGDGSFLQPDVPGAP
jgi:hypothetical protein